MVGISNISCTCTPPPGKYISGLNVANTIKSISSFVKPALSMAILAAFAPITAVVSSVFGSIHLLSSIPVLS